MADQVAAGPGGIRNRGASDYLACVVQAIAHVPEMRDTLLFWDGVPGRNEGILEQVRDGGVGLAEAAGEGEGGAIVAGALRRLVARLVVLGGEEGSEETAGLDDLCRAFGWGRDDIVQQDVNEMFRLLLSKLDEELAGFEVVGRDNVAIEPREDHVSRVAMVNTIRVAAAACGHSSTRVTPSLGINVTVENQSGLEESLRNVTLAAETVSDYRCSTCDAQGDVILSHQFIHPLPPVLMFDLSRIGFSFETFQSVKILDRFEFPFELDMADFVEDNEEEEEGVQGSTLYELAVVVCHTGRATRGHYLAHVKVPSSGEWWKVDDSTVTRSVIDTTQDMETLFGDGTSPTTAYKLIYRRVDEEAAGANGLTPTDLVSPVLMELSHLADA